MTELGLPEAVLSAFLFNLDLVPRLSLAGIDTAVLNLVYLAGLWACNSEPALCF